MVITGTTIIIIITTITARKIAEGGYSFILFRPEWDETE
jgi:hypothetical protein